MMGQNSSVSKTVFLPWIMASVRSTPIPVSTVFMASGRYVPFAVLLYCMKTSFQTSMYLPQLHPGLHSGPQGRRPVSMNISESGPQGPVWPAGPHQLSFRPR